MKATASRAPQVCEPVVLSRQPTPATAQQGAEPSQGNAADAALEQLDPILWPLVANAFDGADERVEARFLQLGDLQLIVSRDVVADGQHKSGTARRVLLEAWLAAGRRVLQIEWHGRTAKILRFRDGGWLPQLLRGARPAE